MNIFPARPVEVVRFVADIARMKRILGVTPEFDPLAHLGDCLVEYRSRDLNPVLRRPLAAI